MITRRRIIRLSAASALAPGLLDTAARAWAASVQPWPGRVVRIIVPYAAGGPTDLISRVVAAGTTDLFNVAFSAECQVRSVGNGDTARIRIAHFVNGAAAAPLEPNDNDQRFCSSPNPPASHAALWAQRVGAGNHVLQVQIMTVDFAPDNGAISSVIDDYAYELVVYD